MSAFEYYAKVGAMADRKRKNKKKSKTNSVKIRKTENGVDVSKKTQHDVLNDVYNLNLKDSFKAGQKLFEWMIHPIGIEKFMK